MAEGILTKFLLAIEMGAIPDQFHASAESSSHLPGPGSIICPRWWAGGDCPPPSTVIVSHTNGMNDPVIREALHRKVLHDHWNTPDTLVIDELGICMGYARVDVAVVNGSIHGYEIKSDQDSLVRLARQVEAYDATLDRITLVTGECHLAKAMALIPEWWGIKVASEGPRGGVKFRDVRRAKKNPKINPRFVAEFLWADETMGILESIGAAEGLHRKSKPFLYDRLVELLRLDEIRDRVRSALKSRADWRSDARRT